METYGPIGLGTFPFSNVFSSLTLSQAQNIVESFVEAGGRYVETAPSYPRPIDLGRVLEAIPRAKLSIATKCVTGFDKDGNRVRSGKREHILAQVQSEIERLRCSHIDLLQTHITPEDVPIENLLETVEELFSQGLIRSFGVSNVNDVQLRALNESGRVSWVQNRLSMIHRTPYMQIRDYCVGHRILVNAYQVLERGQLMPSFTIEQSPREGDLRLAKPEYVGDANDAVRRWFVGLAREVSARFGVDQATLAIRWTLAQPSVGLCVVGATSPEQVSQHMRAQEPLPDDAVSFVDQRFRELQADVRERFGLGLEEFRGLA